MDDNKWKYINKPPACTKPIWKGLIPKDKRDAVLRQIRQECIDIYGYDLDECPKRKVCFTKKCIGRPLPWKSPTALPYLKQLEKTHVIINKELYIENCENCPIKNSCKRNCEQVNDFLNRNYTEEATLLYRDNIDNISYDNYEDKTSSFSLVNGKIPWDILNEKRKSIIKYYLYKQNDFKFIADKLNLNNQAYVKYEFYAGLTKLSEYAKIREFLESKPNITKNQEKILKQIYLNKKSIVEVAKELKLSKQNIQQIVKRVINKYNIKWSKFVYKKNNKVIYNIPKIFK